MRKRPLCLLWIALMALIVVLRLAGVPFTGTPKLSLRAKDCIEQEETLVAEGTVGLRRETAGTLQYHLKEVRIFAGEEQIGALPKLLLQCEKTAPLRIGARVRCEGALSEIEPCGNPGQFDARAYYACSGIYHRMWSERIVCIKEGGGLLEAVSILRNRLTRIICAQTGEREAGVLCGMLLGERLFLDDDTRRAYQIGGILHILAISGLHISFLGLGCFLLLQYGGLPLPLSAALASAFTLLYCLLVGNPASAIRAMVMFIVLMGARVKRRSFDTANALSLAGILILLVNPMSLFLPGFQLSFAAVIGASIVSPKFLALLPKKRRHRGRFDIRAPLARSMLSYLAITLATLPLVAYHYYEIPLLGFLPNLIFLPFVSYLCGLGVFGCLGGLLTPVFAKLCFFPCSLLLQLFHKMLDLLKTVPFAAFVCGRPAIWQIALYYAVFVLLLSGRLGKRRLRHLLLPLAMVLLFLRIGPAFSLTMLDVGQGDALVAKLRGGPTFLVDGGSSSVKELGSTRLSPYLKSQGIGRIDAILISHDDIDHMSGAEELLTMAKKDRSAVQIGAVCLPAWLAEREIKSKTEESKDQMGEQAEYKSSEELLASILTSCDEMNIPVHYLAAGDVIESRGLLIRVLHPFKSGGVREGNAGSMVLELRYESFSALLTGDLEKEGEEELLPYLSKVDYLKVGHHGSRYATGKKLLFVTDPSICAISAPKKSMYGHPHQEVLERIEESGAISVQTGYAGAVFVEADGRHVRIRTQLCE